MGNTRAWKHVRSLFPPGKLDRLVAGLDRQTQTPLDAIDDLGSDTPPCVKSLATSYARDPNVRRAVMQRADGKCEYCGEPGFVSLNGERYLECHHIIALANDGADRMTNVIALCAGDHRKAHFSEKRSSIEQEMIQIVKGAEGRRASRSVPNSQGTVYWTLESP
jgi:predicted restriction endonuclease